MAKLIIVASARQDLSDIFDYIARDKPIAAANWVNKIEEKCKLIATTPEFGEARPEYGRTLRNLLSTNRERHSNLASHRWRS